jgi:molybdate transport system regulatory protein
VTLRRKPGQVSPAPADRLGASLTLGKGEGARVGEARIALLEAIGEHGSIALAAKARGLSYKGAWDAVQAINNLYDAPLVITRAGGARGGLASVTEEGAAVIAAFHAIEAELAHVMETLRRRLAGAPHAPLDSLLWSLAMKTSARNALRGVVKAVTDGAVNAEVAVEVAPGVEIIAVITRHSADDLGLAPGARVIALIKSSFVILARDEGVLKTSARNHLRGKVIRCEDGAVNSEITLELDAGKTLAATITRESRRELDLAVGTAAVALIKASHVILAVE